MAKDILMPVKAERKAGRVKFSTGTIYGLLQNYAEASEVLRFFCPQPEKLLAALDDPERRERTIFMLKYAAKTRTCIDCVRGGEAEDMDYLMTLLIGMLYEFCQEAIKKD